MYKKLILLSVVLLSQPILAATEIDLHQAPLSSLDKYTTLNQKSKAFKAIAASPSSTPNTLLQKNQTQSENQTITRYQQMYKGIPVVGAEVMVSNTQVNGQLINDIQINIQPAISAQKALELAKSSYFRELSQVVIEKEVSELQIRSQDKTALQLVYLVSFKSVGKTGKPVWPFFIIDAQSGVITKQWNNIKNYLDSGPGGNEKVKEYWYGLDGLPGLDVSKTGQVCTMDTPAVKLVKVNSIWDWDGKITTPFTYACGNNTEEYTNGAYSPSNDAYYFGHTIVAMYRDWYGINALQTREGKPMKLVMRVHFGEQYDNAFWDGEAMSFGDGQDFYPLVSLDVAGHEVTHGFTEQHADLEYHDEPGALNESVSDMAGQASRAYLLETNPALYNKTNLEPNTITWGIGETIMRDAYGKALRFMDLPSSDGSSADCLDRNLARSHGAYCAIDYNELKAYAKANISDPDDRQSYIVHTASGVFNKAFYLLAKQIGIKTAYHAMIVANTRYWTPTTDFKKGACGVLYAAKDLSIDINEVKSAFNQVGVDTTQCAPIN